MAIFGPSNQHVWTLLLFMKVSFIGRKTRGDFWVFMQIRSLKTRNFCVKKDTKHDLVSNETITIFID